MNENRKTLTFLVVAVVLTGLAFLLSPNKITPDVFVDEGETFFPEFEDPNTATTLEVVDYDEAAGLAIPFKVAFAAGKWVIPSHNNYPADAKERLAMTAAGLIDIKRDEFRSDVLVDHALFGVIDPLDQSAALSGRGQRVTIKGADNKTLADLILGKPVENKEGFRYVRLPEQSRVYAARVEADISTRFEDWIDTDLLKLTKAKIEKVEIKDYSINERTLSMENRDDFALAKKDNKWRLSSSGAQKIDSAKIELLLDALVGMQIAGVRPKPEGLSSSLKVSQDQKQLTTADVMSLQEKGFYFARDGQMLSNEGEMRVHTSDGIVYTLRFGEVVYGSGLAVTAGSDTTSGKSGINSENRYLFVMTNFDDEYFKTPPRQTNGNYLKKEEKDWTEEDRNNKKLQEERNRRQTKFDNARKMNEELNDRFADWYYVISGESFDKVHLKRSDLAQK